MLQRQPSPDTRASLYLPSLDGLRFFAFLFVFVHHLPATGVLGLQQVHEFGWAGVELFFVISAFLFFHLFQAEAAKTGAISIRKFYIRRTLRIYPLMVAYPIAVIVFVLLTAKASIDFAGMLMQLVALLGLAQNMLNWVTGYATAIPWTQHLWTLSFEFQVYLVIPVAFLAFRRLGTRGFAVAIGCVWLWAFALRAVFVRFDAPHPVIWVTPFLRPESVLIGLLLSMGLFRTLRPAIVVAAMLAAIAMLVSGPNVQQIGGWTLAVYPLVAVIAGCMLWLATNVPAVAAALSIEPLRYLGTISYGLYVYHLFGIYLAQRIVAKSGTAPTEALAHYALVFWLAFGLTVAMAAASYHSLEVWFLNRKKRFTDVSARL